MLRDEHLGARRDLGIAKYTSLRTSRVWMERSAANVRAALPRLDVASRRALVESLRTGAFD